MASSAEDVAGYLADEGLGTLGGASSWGIYVGLEPPSPDQVLTVYDTGGAMGNPDGQMYDPTIQVRGRSHDYDTAYSKLEEVRDLLIVDKTARVIDGWLYTGFWLTADITKIDVDENNRSVLVVNFRLMREPYSTA